MSEFIEDFDGLYILAEVASIFAADDRLLDQQSFFTTTENRATPPSMAFMDSVPKKKRSCLICKQVQAVMVERTSHDSRGNSYHLGSEQEAAPKSKKQRTTAMSGSDHKTRPTWSLLPKSPVGLSIIKAA